MLLAPPQFPPPTIGNTVKPLVTVLPDGDAPAPPPPPPTGLLVSEALAPGICFLPPPYAVIETTAPVTVVSPPCDPSVKPEPEGTPPAPPPPRVIVKSPETGTVKSTTSPPAPPPPPYDVDVPLPPTPEPP